MHAHRVSECALLNLSRSIRNKDDMCNVAFKVLFEQFGLWTAVHMIRDAIGSVGDDVAMTEQFETFEQYR